MQPRVNSEPLGQNLLPILTKLEHYMWMSHVNIEVNHVHSPPETPHNCFIVVYRREQEQDRVTHKSNYASNDRVSVSYNLPVWAFTSTLAVWIEPLQLAYNPLQPLWESLYGLCIPYLPLVCSLRGVPRWLLGVLLWLYIIYSNEAPIINVTHFPGNMNGKVIL